MDTEEAKRRAEWLNEHRAPKDWLIVTESEISSARTEFSAIERERDEAREQIKVLHDMINDAIDNAEELTMYGRDLCRELRQIAVVSRIELDQLKEDAK